MVSPFYQSWGRKQAGRSTREGSDGLMTHVGLYPHKTSSGSFMFSSEPFLGSSVVSAYFLPVQG